MAFNPFQEKGIPVEKQLRSWNELNIEPYDKKTIDPYTRSRIILMNGVEVEAAIFGHQFARRTDDLDLKRSLALTRRLEQQQQKVINWQSPADESPLETTIGYEQVAVDLTAFLAAREPDPYVKAALDFALLEDFDHLYRYANLYEMTTGKQAEELTRKYTEITVGRPTFLEHRHPFDEVRKHYDRKKADPLTMMQVMTIVAGEQQTMNFYMNVGNQPGEMVGRGLYQEIGMIEEQHVTHYESLLDPRESWFECLVMHELHECYLYHSFMIEEEDERIRQIWERHLGMEVEHLRLARELMKKYEKADPADMLPPSLPEPVSFRSNIDYVREILSTQIEYNAHETEFLPADRFPGNGRYKMYQSASNSGGAPSEQVIEQQVGKKKRDYRLEIQGPHPVEIYRQPGKAKGRAA